MSDAPLPPGPRRITSTRDKAKMTYLPPDLDVDALIASTPNFKAIPRLDATQLETEESFASLEEFIEKHVIVGGTPLVIENWHKRRDWPWYIFTTQWLKENNGGDHINVRDLGGAQDITMSLGHYLSNLPKLANKFTTYDYAGKQQRLYAKDIDCPLVWRDKLKEILPPSTFYLSTQGDLMSSLPELARAENMMCYFGHEGTYTPAHKEMCASLGQNIMVDASSGSSEPGTSIWFMTQSADRDVIAEYWLSRMGHDIEVESHFASIDDLQDAPFPVYIHEQRVGDYILVPPLAPHQVWNRGEATLKAAWNRITVDTLELAISESLPKARLVCRDEQYKNRAIVYETLKEYAQILNGEKPAPHMDLNKMRSDFVRLFRLFDRIVLDECFSPEKPPPAVEKIENEYNVTCSFCRSNIWNRFLSCKNCVIVAEGEDDDCYDICMDCYARGRSCFCVSKLDWVEQHDWKVIEEDHEGFRRTVMDIQGVSDDNPVISLSKGLKQLGRKSLARVCQEQLKIRPWQDINKNGLEDGEIEDEDPEKKKRDGKTLNCHVCKVRHDTWKCAECSSCTKVYCYGNLWRAFDLDPFDDVLCKFAWKCPVCLGICSCGACRKKAEMQPYEPNGTFLGAPTKHVADPRSIESLVDFAKGNLGWIRDPDATATAKRKRASTNGFGHLGMTHDNSFDNGHVPVDPALGGNLRTAPSPASHGFTAVNAENEASSADVEGRFLPASTENREEIGSNSFGSVQAHLLIAQQDRMREAERGQEGSDRSRGVLGRGTEEEGHNSAIQSTAGHMGIELHPNSNIFNQTHYTPFDSNIAPWNSGHHPGSSSAMDHHFSGDQPGTHQPLTALEENPLAFIAAAGLLSLPGGDTSSSSQWPSVTPAAPPQELYTQPHLLEKVPPLPPATPTPTQPHHMEKDPSLLPSATPTPAQPHHMEMDPSLLPSATPTPAQPHHMEMDPPSPPSATPTPEKNPRPLPRRPRVKTEVNFGLNALRPERESQIGDWVRKTKAANRWTKNLKKKKTLIVKLHPPFEGFSILVDALLERDKVTSDLYSIGPGQFVTVFDAVSSANSNREPDESAPPKRKRGRPRKISRNVDPQSDSDEVAFIGAGAVATPADKEKSTQRRREAYLRRKKEEDEAKAQFLSATHHGVGKQEVLNMLRNQPEQFREGSDTEMYHFQPPPLPEETEEEKLARQALEEVERQRKAAEEEAVRIQREAEEEATRIQRQREEEIAIIKRAAEEAQRIAMEAERLRIQAEEKAARKAARAKLHAEEKERKRKEADRNAKLVAAGVLNSSDVDEYISSAAGDDDSFDSEKERIQSPQIPPGFDEFFDDFFPEDKKEALIPREWNFAVIIDPPSSDDGWRDSYTPLSRLSPDPPSLMASLPLIHTAPTQPQQPTRRRGRPRKHPLPTDNATVTPQSRPSTAKKPRTSRRKSAPLKGDSSFRAFRTQRNVQTLSVERGRRRSAVDVKKYSFEESEEETVARRPAKKRRISKVQVKPGKWAAVEITESEGEAEKKESLPADVEANRWEVIEGFGGGVRKESDGEKQAEEQGEGVDDAGMELGNEYEKRWNREKRKRWF